MGEFMRLDEFDDFIEIASGCSQVFYQVNEVKDGTELIAYASRVYWKGEYENSKEFDDRLEVLKDNHAKRVLETSDSVFR